MTQIYGQYFMMNGQEVTPPDDIRWEPVVIGEDLNALQKRSHYSRCVWTKRAVLGCDMDWFDYDNTELTSFVCPPTENSKVTERFTTAIVQQVKGLHTHGSMYDISMTILVKVE